MYLNKENNNEAHPVPALQCGAMHPARKVGRTFFGVDSVSNKCLSHRLDFVVMIFKNMDFVQLFNSAGRGWLKDL